MKRSTRQMSCVSRVSRVFCILIGLAGCNGILGIEEATLRSSDGGAADARGEDGLPNGDGSPGDGSSGGDGNIGDTSTSDAEPPLKPGPYHCTLLSQPIVASKGASPNGTALAYRASLGKWGLAWNVGNAVDYNEIDDAGKISYPTDLRLLKNVGTVDSIVHMTTLVGTPQIVAAVGTLDAGNAYVEIVGLGATNDPSFVGSFGPVTDSGLAMRVGDIAAENQSAFTITARRGSGVLATPSTIARFASTTPSFAIDGGTPTATATSIAWLSATNHYGIVWVGGSDEAIGTLSTGLQLSSPLAPLKAAGDDIFPQYEGEVAIAAAGTRFAIAWVNLQAPNVTINLTVVDATSLTRTTANAEVVVSAASAGSKGFPHVVSDGRSIGVAWIELVSAGNYNVMFRRFSLDLVPLDDAPDGGGSIPTCVSCGLGGAAIKAN